MTSSVVAVLSVVDADSSGTAEGSAGLAGSARALSLDDLGARIVGLAGRLAAASCRWLLLVAEFDLREGWARFGLSSTAQWLSHQCGLARRTAVEQVRVARALVQFPALAREMSAGRLSYSQVRAISRVPGVGEHGVVDDLIEVAQHGTAAHLETVVRGMRTVHSNADDDTGGSPGVPEESVEHGWTDGSQWRLTARLDPEHGGVVQAAIEAVARVEQLSSAQALVRMAEMALVAVADGAATPRPLRGDERAAFVIHIDASDLIPEPEPEPKVDPAPAPGPAQAATPATEPASASGTRADNAGPRSAERVAGAGARLRRGWAVGRIVGGPGLPRPVINRLLCSGRIRTAVRDGHGKVLDLGRSQRVVSERQFRALLLRDEHCNYPGCVSRAGMEAHHVRHWINGGRTDMDNLVLMCERHHHLLHDGGFTITALGGERFQFLRSDGRVLLANAAAMPNAEDHDDDHIDDRIDDRMRDIGWGGEPLDGRWAIAVLAQRREQARLRDSADRCSLSARRAD